MYGVLQVKIPDETIVISDSVISTVCCSEDDEEFVCSPSPCQSATYTKVLSSTMQMKVGTKCDTMNEVYKTAGV